MGSFSQSRSPVLALPPQLPPQNTFAMEYHRPSFTSPFNAGDISGANPSPPSSGWSNRTPTFTPSSTAGRKRSRDEAAENLEDDEYFPNVKTTLPPPVENEDEWEYGEGMTLVKPNQHYSITAESQSGTWVDERVEPQQSPTPAQSPQRPAYRPSKSQRLNLTATTDIPDDINLNGSSSQMTPLSSTSGNGVNPNSGPTEPTVDDFTRHLGIGWSSISTNSNLQAAARGWAKYIENHFPVTGANIRLQSRGLSSYLVEANEGYFLFGEDLKQGRLISTNLARTWENLRSNPPAFDGQIVLEASTSPKVNSTPPAEDLTMSATTTLQQETGHWSHGPAIQKFSQPAAQNVEVEMDMS